jgi:glycosyltransferase involved in cell wall biosynthesis
MNKKKLIRVTTADISLDSLLKGQLKYLNQYFEVVGVAKDTGVLQQVAEREGIRVVNAPLERPISLAKDIKALWFLYKLFYKERPWCVHANTPKGSLLSMIASWMARVPRRVYLVTGLRYQSTQGALRLLLKTMERLSCHFATHVIPEGQGVLHILQADHITHKPLRVLHYGNINGRDTNFLSIVSTVRVLKNKKDDITENDIQECRKEVRERFGFDNDNFIFVFIGRMVHDKGINELIGSMRRLIPEFPKLKLLLIGEMDDNLDPLASENIEFISSSPAINYMGQQKDIRPYLLISDALVFPSYREGFPNVPIEAGSMNLPSIVTNISGCNEIIKDGLNGKIIEAPLDNKGKHVNDITDPLYNAMKWFLTHPEEVERMASNSRKMIQERYEQKDVWHALYEYYNQL